MKINSYGKYTGIAVIVAIFMGDFFDE